MAYVVAWGRGNRRQVSTAAELDAALDKAAEADTPRVVGIYPPEHFNEDTSAWDEELPPSLEIGVGHPDRSFALWLGPEGGIGVEAAIAPWPDGAPDIAFDYGGDPVFCGPDRTQVTPAAARTGQHTNILKGPKPVPGTHVRPPVKPRQPGPRTPAQREQNVPATSRTR